MIFRDRRGVPGSVAYVPVILRLLIAGGIEALHCAKLRSLSFLCSQPGTSRKIIAVLFTYHIYSDIPDGNSLIVPPPRTISSR